MKNKRILRALSCLLAAARLLAYPVTVACGAEEEKGSITLKWDRWAEETFVKQQDGTYRSTK